ncbi:hypothetical protein H4R34_001238 [Dimargaris verticillata]|uniref:C2H2-type domain-containing protein n=1 Tax=Dimargaris verticillata TaxID=2761393 RepID=A0A9W8B5U6_9FUNG|nr:hypothetical protein H4R34_001238 [Dimargaris verticillata]
MAEPSRSSQTYNGADLIHCTPPTVDPATQQFLSQFDTSHLQRSLFRSHSGQSYDALTVPADPPAATTPAGASPAMAAAVSNSGPSIVVTDGDMVFSPVPSAFATPLQPSLVFEEDRSLSQNALMMSLLTSPLVGGGVHTPSTQMFSPNLGYIHSHTQSAPTATVDHLFKSPDMALQALPCYTPYTPALATFDDAAAATVSSLAIEFDSSRPEFSPFTNPQAFMSPLDTVFHGTPSIRTELIFPTPDVQFADYNGGAAAPCGTGPSTLFAPLDELGDHPTESTENPPAPSSAAMPLQHHQTPSRSLASSSASKFDPLAFAMASASDLLQTPPGSDTVFQCATAIPAAALGGQSSQASKHSNDSLPSSSPVAATMGKKRRLMAIDPSATAADDMSSSPTATTPTSATKRPKAETTKRRFQCDVPGCTFSSARAYNLSTHRETHYPVLSRKFKCDQCDRAFSRRHDLMRHTASIHKGEKQFVCPQCNKPYSRNDALNRHILKHAQQQARTAAPSPSTPTSATLAK